MMRRSSLGNLSSRELARIGWCALMVVGLHASLLAIPARSAAPRSDIAASPQATQLRAVRAADLPPVPTTVASVWTSHVPEPARTPVKVARPGATGRVAFEPPSALVSGAATSPPLPDLGLYAWAADPMDDYYPHEALTVRPAPRGVVQIDYPAFEGERDYYVSELVLLVDETGVVSRVLVAGPPLPAPLDGAARSAFSQALFTPGELDGRAVRSRIRVEVVFDSRRIAS